ncbi:MAG: beta-lactamase family protein [Reichenbachiella sp.]
MRSEIQSYVAGAISENVFPGCVIGTVTKNGVKEVEAFGAQTYNEGAPSITATSLYDCASITKSVPTALLALKLLEAGSVSLDDPVNRYIDGYQMGLDPAVQVKHLLTHTVDYRFSLAGWKDKSAIEILEKLYIHDFNLPPGETFCYCNASSIVLGVLISTVYGGDFQKVAQAEVFDALDMNRTSFFPKETFDADEIVPSEDDPWRGRIIKGEVHDESAYALRELFVAGSAGLFSTAPDLLNPMLMLLNGGIFNDTEFLSREWVEQIYRNQIQHLGLFTGLGFELNQQRYMGDSRTTQTFGKTGFTGCNLLGDVSKEKALVILSNYTWPTRKRNPDRINRFRADIADILF